MRLAIFVLTWTWFFSKLSGQVGPVIQNQVSGSLRSAQYLLHQVKVSSQHRFRFFHVISWYELFRSLSVTAQADLLELISDSEQILIGNEFKTFSTGGSEYQRWWNVSIQNLNFPLKRLETCHRLKQLFQNANFFLINIPIKMRCNYTEEKESQLLH